MGKTAIPSVFPAEGTYELSTLHVNLSCAAPHAVIRYTTDGTEPTSNSPVYHREAGLIPAPSALLRRQMVCSRAILLRLPTVLPAAPKAYSAILCCANRRIRLPVSSVLRISISTACISS